MRYYRLEDCVDMKEVGTQYPQVHDFIKGYDPEPEAHGIFSLYETRKKGFPEKAPDLSGLKLASGAQYSDFLSQGFTFDLFLLNERAMNVLKTLHIDGDYRAYPAIVNSLRKKTTKEYYMMQILSDNFRYVDFANSLFYMKEDECRTPIHFSSYQDFMETPSSAEELRKRFCAIRFTKIKMTNEFYDLGKDLFQVGTINRDWFVSQRFVDAIKENGLTGLEFKEADL